VFAGPHADLIQPRAAEDDLFAIDPDLDVRIVRLDHQGAVATPDAQDGGELVEDLLGHAGGPT
jgi:hypothetical protein